MAAEAQLLLLTLHGTRRLSLMAHRRGHAVEVECHTEKDKAENDTKKNLRIAGGKALHLSCSLVQPHRLRKGLPGLHTAVVKVFVFRIVLVGHLLPDNDFLEIHSF